MGFQLIYEESLMEYDCPKSVIRRHGNHTNKTVFSWTILCDNLGKLLTNQIT